MELNVLNITFDGNLARADATSQFSGAQKRQLDYAARLDTYVIVGRGYRDSGLEPVRLAPNLLVVPTRSINNGIFIYDAYRFGLQLAFQYRINCLCCANPFGPGLAAYLLKRRLKLPLNVHIMGDIIDNPYFNAQRRINPLFNAFGKWVLRRADTIRVSTEVQRNEFIRRGWDERRVWNIPFYVDLAPFVGSDGYSLATGDDGGVQARLLGDRFTQMVLTVSRLSWEKDPFTLIDAIPIVLSLLPQTLFVIAGEGETRPHIERRCRELGVMDNVHLTGAIPFSQIAHLYHACDVVVMTSVYEGTCMVLQEAAASGKPVVATAFAGAMDAIAEAETGYIVPIKDSRQLAARIAQLLSNPSQARQMGARAREAALKRFRKDEILQCYRAMLETTVSLHREPGRG
jgi:glycosyltransferase involved in cell wall biosynthesis